MDLFEQTLLRYLRGSKIKMEITGFDMEGFSKAMHRELNHRLDTIESIVLEDTHSSDSEKVAAIKLLFERDFYS